MYLIVAALAFFTTLATTPVLIRKFGQAGITGKDKHKPGQPDIPEMGGMAVVTGISVGILVAVAISTLAARTGIGEQLVPYDSLAPIFAALTTILLIAHIGVFDDLVEMRQSVKALLPIFASMPLVAVAAGNPNVTIPSVGSVYLPVIYPLLLIPLGVTVAANLTNMLAGFNGSEAGMGLVACSGLAVVAWRQGAQEALVLMLASIGALAAFLIFNKFPARIFIGDVGTLAIGASIASAVIVGNFELAAVVVLAPYLMDFALKAKNHFPKEVSMTEVKDGKITSPKAVGLPSLIMKLVGGISESRLVLTLISVEAVFSLLAILLFW